MISNIRIFLMMKVEFNTVISNISMSIQNSDIAWIHVPIRRSALAITSF